MTIDFTLAVCTYNRCDSLAETLASFRTLVVPTGLRWEIVIVDNNSSDETRHVVELFSRDAPTETRYVFEGRQGVAYARNRAVEAARGTFILFTDDDIIVDSQWLVATAAAFEEHRADCVGGRVLPLWLGSRPQWLGDSLLNVLALLDYGDRPLELGRGGDDRFLYTANAAFRRERLLEIGAFNTLLGTGEDLEVQRRLQQAGGKIMYAPSSVVLHKVDPGRLTKNYFRHWFYRAGRDRAMTRRPSRFFVFGIESYLIRQFFQTFARLITSAILLKWKRVFELELHCILYLSVFKHKLIVSSREQPDSCSC